MKPVNIVTIKLWLCIVLYAMTTVAQATTLYKWVDENGDIRYSDRPPVKKKHQALNAQGVVIETKEAPKSDQQLTAEKQAEQEKKAQQALDRVLLMTFSSEEELALVHDNRIEVIESVIRLIDKSIVTTQQRLTELQEDAKTLYLSKNLEVPGGLAQNIEHFTKKLDSQKVQLQAKINEKDKIEAQYNKDLARYRFLKNQ